TPFHGPRRQPYTQYSRLTTSVTGYAHSSYQSFQLKVERRFAKGGMMLAAYTVGKLIAESDTQYGWLEVTTGGVGGIQNWNCIRCSRSISSQDVPQRLVISYVQNLPFGQGQRFLSGAHGLAGKLVSGWGLDGI